MNQRTGATLPIAVLLVLMVVAGSVHAASSTNRGVASVFARDHGGVALECPEWVGEIFPGAQPPGCVTFDVETIALARAMLDRTVDDIDGIAWTSGWDTVEGGDAAQMVHRQLAIDGEHFVATLRLAGPSREDRQVLLVVQRGNRPAGAGPGVTP